MQSFLFDLGTPPSKPGFWTSFKSYLKEKVITSRFDSPIGYFFSMILAYLIAFGVGTGGLSLGLWLLGIVLAIPLLTSALFHVRFGLMMTLGASFFILGIKRYTGDLPLGIFIDASILIVLAGIFLKQIRERDWSFIKHPLCLGVAIWMGYNLLQLANPLAPSQIAWFYTVRATAGHMSLFFAGLYVLKSPKAIRQLSFFWISLVTLGAIYGLIQEIWGLSQTEWEWVTADSERFRLFHTWGRFRIFSFFSDPTVLGIMMAFTLVFSMAFLFDPLLRKGKKILIGAAMVCMLIAMVLSGTRTAFLLVPAGLFFFALLNKHKKVLLFMGAIALLGTVIVIVPSKNTHILRIQSAFSPLESGSFQIRAQNQKYIQPFIRSSPFGKGLGSTGIWGQRFSPETMLSEFPPDSGYVRIAIEMGWIGLALFCGLMFLILWTGVKGFFAVEHPRAKTYYLAFLSAVFMLILAHFPQQAITQLPNSLFFYLSMAVLITIPNIKWEQQPEAEVNNQLTPADQK